MTNYISERLSGLPAYEQPDLLVCAVKPDRGFAASGSLENVTEEDTETQW